MSVPVDSRQGAIAVENEYEYHNDVTRKKDLQKKEQEAHKKKLDEHMGSHFGREYARQKAFGGNQVDTDLLTQIMVITIGAENAKFVLKVADGEDERTANRRVSQAWNAVMSSNGIISGAQSVNQDLNHSLQQQRLAQQAAERARVAQQSKASQRGV